MTILDRRGGVIFVGKLAARLPKPSNRLRVCRTATDWTLDAESSRNRWELARSVVSSIELACCGICV